MAKPQSPLTEFAACWCPIFADPERDYYYLTALRSFRRTKCGARFRLASDDTIAHLALTFVESGHRPCRSMPSRA